MIPFPSPFPSLQQVDGEGKVNIPGKSVLGVNGNLQEQWYPSPLPP